MSFCDYWENELLDHAFMKGVYTPPTNIFVALSTTTPTDAGGNVTEPVGGSYARESTAGTDWDVASGGATANATAITFTQATGDWGTVTHFVLYDAITAGNALAWSALDTSRTINTGDTAEFAIGALDVTLD